MPKMKTSRTASKRFKVTGKGRLRRSKAGGSHLLQGKSRKRRRRLRDSDTVSSADHRRIIKLLR